MLRLVDISEIETDHITFQTEEIGDVDAVPYVVYDTSTGVPIYQMEDYVCWRAITTLTTTGSTIYEFIIDNTNIFPSYSSPIADYTQLNPKLFRIVTLQEYTILMDVLTRLDLVRKRLPNPGTGIDSTDGIGQDGIVSFAGGHEKKMTVGEICLMIEAAIIEINGTPPRTMYWPNYGNVDSDKINNPYMRASGFPMDMTQLVTLGALIRCLVSVGIMEVDISFSTSDSGLQLTFDRHAAVKSWYDSFLTDYKEQKTLFKWNHANHAGVGIGTLPWAATGIWGTLMNNTTFGGQLALSSVLGFSARGNVPL